PPRVLAELADRALGAEAEHPADRRAEERHRADHARVAERTDGRRQPGARREERRERIEELVRHRFGELAQRRTAPRSHCRARLRLAPREPLLAGPELVQNTAG